MAAAAIFKIERLLYLHYVLTNFDEIWHNDASRPSKFRTQQPIKFWDFKNPKNANRRQ